jgi:hypothetical protein
MRNVHNDAEEQTLLSARAPIALRDALFRLARERDRSMSAEIRIAVQEYLRSAEREKE